MKLSRMLVVAATGAAALALAPSAMAVGESGSTTVAGTVTGSLAITVPTPAALTTMTVGTNEWAESNVVVSDTDATKAWILKANESGGDGKMSVFTSPVAGLCTVGTALTNAMQIKAAAATSVVGGTVTINATSGSPLTLSGTLGNVATGVENAVSAAVVPVTYMQTVVTGDNIKAGCVYSMTVGWELVQTG